METEEYCILCDFELKEDEVSICPLCQESQPKETA